MVAKLVEKLRMSEMNGTVIQTILALLELWKFFWQYLLLRRVILQKEPLGAPAKVKTFNTTKVRLRRPNRLIVFWTASN